MSDVGFGSSYEWACIGLLFLIGLPLLVGGAIMLLFSNGFGLKLIFAGAIISLPGALYIVPDILRDLKSRNLEDPGHGGSKMVRLIAKSHQ